MRQDFAPVSILQPRARLLLLVSVPAFASSTQFEGLLIPQIAARGHGIAHDVELTQKMVPFITCETAFRKNVVELVSGVNVFDLDFAIQVHSVK